MTLIQAEATPEAEEAPDPITAAKAELSPCPVCGRAWSSGPEKEAWYGGHCWKCGFRPGQRVHASLVLPGQQTADTAKLVAELRSGVVSDVLSALQQAGIVNVSYQPPSGQSHDLGTFTAGS